LTVEKEAKFLSCGFRPTSPSVFLIAPAYM